MKLIEASYYKPFNAASDYKPEYSFYFDLGCDYALNIFHIKGVVGEIAVRVPKEPSGSSASKAQSAASRGKCGAHVARLLELSRKWGYARLFLGVLLIVSYCYQSTQDWKGGNSGRCLSSESDGKGNDLCM